METIKLNDVKTADILLVSGYSWLSKKIQKFQEKTVCVEYAAYNHAATFWKIYDELYVVDAQRKGVVPTYANKYFDEKRKYLVLRPKFYVDGSEYGKLIHHYVIIDSKGKRHTTYDKFNLLVAQPIYILTNGRVWLGENSQNDRKFICGEFVHHIYKTFEPKLFPENSAKFKPCEFLLKQDIFDVFNLDFSQKTT